jgi:hypothetical protein
LEEGGDVYLASSSAHVDHEAWMVNSGASFHINPHREWFCEYEMYDGGDVFLGDDSTTKIMGRGKFKLNLLYGRIITLPSILHILGFSINLIFVRKMDDVGVKIVFEKETYRMVQREMVFLKGVRIGTMYKLQGSTICDGCNSSSVLEIGSEEEKTLVVSGKGYVVASKIGAYRREGILTITW